MMIWTNNLRNLSGVIICKICIIRHLELQFVKFTKRNDNLQFANDDHHFVLFLHDDRHIITLPISPFNDVSTMTTIYFLQAYYQKIMQTLCCSLNTKVCWTSLKCRILDSEWQIKDNTLQVKISMKRSTGSAEANNKYM